MTDTTKTTIEQKDAFDQACGMEKPLERIRQFTAGLARLAPTIDDGQAAAIVRELTLAIEESLGRARWKSRLFLPASPSRARTI